MDRKFMEDYYWMKYQDGFMVKAIESDEECRELYHKVMELEGKAEAVMRKEGKESLSLHGELHICRAQRTGRRCKDRLSCQGQWNPSG